MVNFANYTVRHFDSLVELEDDNARPYTVTHNKNCAASYVNEDRGEGWLGVKGGAKEVYDCIRNGYPAGAADVDALYDSLEAKLPRAIDTRRKIRRSDQGDELDIHAVNRGDLSRAWSTAKRNFTHGTNLIRVVVDICANSGTSSQQLKWRGVAALALTRSLTRAGYSCEIVASWALHEMLDTPKNKNIKRHCLITCTVKPRHANSDTATLAATVCLPGFFRTWGFMQIVRAADEQGVNVDTCLGRAVATAGILPAPDNVAQIITPVINCEADARQFVIDSHALLQGVSLSKEKV